MSGGGGGIIIIKRLAETDTISKDDRKKLHEIADRNPLWCGRMDALQVVRIVWKYIRRK